MWCPSASLSTWANAWLAGRAAPDDVLDALSARAPTHSVTAYDSVAAGRTGLPWPDVDDAGAMSLLQTLRTAAGRRADIAWPARPGIGLVLPVPGDVRGLAAGTQFQRDALNSGEAIIITGPDAEAVGLVPDFEYDDTDDELPDGDRVPELCALSWTVYSLPSTPLLDHLDLGEAEYTLRSAVRSAAEALSALQLGSSGAVDDPRGLVEQVLETNRHHRAPDHAPARALRVLENAARVDAIITVSSGLMPIGTQSASAAQIADEALRPLAGVVRSARIAAVNAILESAWH
ncbi:hypothetical protein [Candidatus Mycolicibacterium alkanivorans]|uniref:Uncharacterized protein n=1 Tax=Candidatus Mycolicibacterium alkanivorans TaxID=2954114 RepID=A0ABS9YXW0_9MYCO|nr:hypothetical protein [Candidatus Mycolicibacterium alkanivorans]MCI4676064.1 hypothetical protein [Candidatus Mycolicibacterium alkanivorans]